LNPAKAFRGNSLREEDQKAMKDLRDYIATCEKEGELRRVKAEVDWDLELSHICKVVEEKSYLHCCSKTSRDTRARF